MRRLGFSISTIFIAGLLIATGGCGGSGGGTPNSTAILRGVVGLPTSGSALKLAVSSGASNVSVTAGQFEISLGLNNLRVVSLIDTATGKVVLLGLADGATGNLGLDAVNCARTLTFLSLGGSQFSPADRKTLWTTISASSDVSALATVLTTELTADIFVLENGNANVKTALATAVNALSGGVPMAPTVAKDIPKVVSRDSDPPPTYQVGGQELDKPKRGEIVPNGTGFIINNYYSRVEGRFFNYNVGYVDNKFVKHSTVTKAISGELEFSSNSASEQFNPPFDPANSEDLLATVVLQPIFDQAEPAFFSDSAYSAQVASWRASLAKMYRRGLGVVAAASMLDAFGAPEVDFNSETTNQVVTGLTGVSSSAASVFSDSDAGKGLGALVARLAAVPAGSDADAFSTLAALSPYLKASYPELAQQLATRSLSSAQIQGFRGSMRILSLMGSWDYSSKSGRIANGYTTGNMATLGQGSIGIRGLSLTPNSSYFDTTKSLLLTVKPHPGYTHPFTYTYSIDPAGYPVKDAVLNDNQGHVGREIVTTSPTCYLVTAPNLVGSVVVHVEAQTKGDDGLPRYLVAEAVYSPIGALNFSPIFLDFKDSRNNTLSIGYSATWVRKPAPTNGVYAGGKLVVDYRIDDVRNPGINEPLTGTYHGEFNVPAYSGAIIPSSQVLFDSDPRHIYANVIQSTGPFIGLTVFDYGDQFLIINTKVAPQLPPVDQSSVNLMQEWAAKTQARFSFK